ncbi:sigma factor G inhibitor Gin [Tumebacillus permanentifrigoris]|uniref:Inhibitor of sigma-G Gin protein n=1 Tax=Tumebacillus permanentifrigoris TaxID=378543 RepID=A0A316D2Z5_9BACL|nr:sigma factor G inhibitor Gin [Tumebacillus permanentifrigoris]PWK05163.1 inhibitor of sigma-G Gin protein [Tumebacillus permanentifrigoris]
MEEHHERTGGTCIVCSTHKELGIRIYQQFMCTDCEREIVQTDVQDAKYPFYIDRMKQIWLSATS